MTQTTEVALRNLGGIIAFAAISAGLVWLSNIGNLGFLNSALAPLIAAVASVALSALDKAYSPNGTVAFGSIG